MFIDRTLHQKSLMLSDQHFVSSSLTCILSSFFFVSSLNSYLYHCFYTLLHFTRTSACYSSQHTPLLLSHFLLKMVGFVCPPFSLETIDVAMCFKNSTLFSFIYYFSFLGCKGTFHHKRVDRKRDLLAPKPPHPHTTSGSQHHQKKTHTQHTHPHTHTPHQKPHRKKIPKKRNCLKIRLLNVHWRT